MKSLEVGKGVFIKKLYFLVFLLCLIVLIWPTSEVLAASSWQISGAGDNSYNGTYVESGVCNGNPRYVLNGNRYLFRAKDMAGTWIWRLFTACQAGPIPTDASSYYGGYVFGGENPLPGNPWHAGLGGVAPPPTLNQVVEPPAPGPVDNPGGSVDNPAPTGGSSSSTSTSPGSSTSPKTVATKTVDNPDNATVTAPLAPANAVTSPSASSAKKTGVLAAFWDRNAAKVNAVVVALTAALMLAPALVNLAFGLSDLLPRILYWLTQGLQMLGLRKKRKPWGVVFNAQTGQAVGAAVVRIFDREYKKMLESAVTDKQGRFGFLVRPGTFYLTVSKTGYTQNATANNSEVASASAFFSNLYSGGDIKINKEQAEQTILMNVPLEPQVKASWIFSFWVKIVKLNRVLQKIRIPLMILGTAFAVLMILTAYHLIYILSLAFYIVLFILEIFKVKKTRPYGVVSNTDDRPLELSIVRIFNKKNDRLVGTDVTDIRGRFKFLVDPGSYYLTTMKPGFSDFKSHLLHLIGDKTLVAMDIRMRETGK